MLDDVEREGGERRCPGGGASIAGGEPQAPGQSRRAGCVAVRRVREVRGCQQGSGPPCCSHNTQLPACEVTSAALQLVWISQWLTRKGSNACRAESTEERGPRGVCGETSGHTRDEAAAEATGRANGPLQGVGQGLVQGQQQLGTPMNKRLQRQTRKKPGWYRKRSQNITRVSRTTVCIPECSKP